MGSNAKVVFRVYPLFSWFTGVMALGIWAMQWTIGLEVPDDAWERRLLFVVGMLFVGFGSVLTISVDQRCGLLNLHYRSLFRSSTTVYPFDAIASVHIAEDSEGERMYRVELHLRSGQVIPLQGSYSIGKSGKERRARQLRSAMGIGV